MCRPRGEAHDLGKGNGVADDALLAAVTAHVEPKRTLNDRLIVQSVDIVEYALKADINVRPGPDAGGLYAAIKTATEQVVADRHGLGIDVVRSALDAALHQSGVDEVTITSPNLPIRCTPGQAAFCTEITLTSGGRDV